MEYYNMSEINKTDEMYQYFDKLDKLVNLLKSKGFTDNRKNSKLLFGELEGKMNPEAFAYAERILKQAYSQVFKEKLITEDFRKIIVSDEFETRIATYVNETGGDRFTIVCSDMVRLDEEPCAGIIIDYTYETVY